MCIDIRQRQARQTVARHPATGTKALQAATQTLAAQPHAHLRHAALQSQISFSKGVNNCCVSNDKGGCNAKRRQSRTEGLAQLTQATPQHMCTIGKAPTVPTVPFQYCAAQAVGSPAAPALPYITISCELIDLLEQRARCASKMLSRQICKKGKTGPATHPPLVSRSRASP